MSKPPGAAPEIEVADLSAALPSSGLKRQARGQLDLLEVPELGVLAAQAASALSVSPFESLCMAAAGVLGRYARMDSIALSLERGGRRARWTARVGKGCTFRELATSLDTVQPAVEWNSSVVLVDRARVPSLPGGSHLSVGHEAGTVWIGFDAGILSPAAVERLAGHLGRLLEAAAGEPDGYPADHEILRATEIDRFDAWNSVATDYGLERFVDRFQEQLARNPDAIAAEEPGRRITYAELSAAANRLASHLWLGGMGPEKVVGIVLNRGIEALVAVVATFKTGAAYFPIDHTNPAHRLGLAINQGQPDLCLVHRDLLPIFRNACAAADRDFPFLVFEELGDEQPDPPNPERGADDLAYLLSTSGSTGIPKVTMIEQRGMVNHSLGMIDLLDLSPSDVLAQNAPLTFDISVWQLITPLMVGARVSFVPDEVLGAPDRLLEWANASEVTHLQIVPSLMASILQLTEYEPDLAFPDSLRWIIPTGEALPVDIAIRWMERFPSPPLVNAYGPAECSDDVTIHRVEAPPSPDLISMPIGRPLPNVAVYVLDRHDKRAPVGVVGEICVGGTGVGRGYRNDPERTAVAFGVNPFPPYGRLYRTGDLGRFLEDGSLQYVGRVDHQVKVGGIRIELGEVESALADHPHVRQVVGVTTGSRLIAYFTDAGLRSPSREELRLHMSERLPAYMVPQTFVHLSELPLNRNGKIDRAALPEPTADDLGVGSASDTATASETERRLVEIWQDLLQCPVGFADDFFGLGGTSLLAAVMLWRVRRELGADLPISTPARAPTVRTLAALIDDSAGHPQHLVPLRTGGSRTPLFLAPGQGGSTLGFVKLARHLPPDRPVWGLDLQRRRDEPAEPQTFDMLVERYLSAMRSVQPKGPYLVGGWCLGGEVAFEIAQRLRREGDEAALVVLLQTDNVDYPSFRRGVGPVRRVLLAALDRLSYEKAIQRALPRSKRARYALEEILVRTLIKLRLPLESLLAAALSRLGRPYRGSDEYHQRRWYRADGAAYEGHTFAPYDGDVIQIRARNQPRGIEPDPTLGWGDLVTGRLDTVEVDGWHWNFLREPVVRQVAEQLSRRLDEMDESGRATASVTYKGGNA